ncbi:lysozyme [Dickeya phage Sucellus]|nr:lysozyme [Dickeya phage Sucellus]
MKKNGAIICAVFAIVAIIAGNKDEYKSKNGNELRFSEESMLLIGDAEGCRKDVYKCPANLWTIGIGHTGGVTALAKNASNEQIAEWFAEDLINAQNCIEQNVESRIKTELTQGMFDAIGSFIFNIGCGKFIKSTMFKMIIDKDNLEACNQLQRWVYAGKEILPGLVERRSKERIMCIRGLK